MTLLNAGAIKDSIVAEESMVRHLLSLLTQPRQQHVLERLLHELRASDAGKRRGGAGGRRQGGFHGGGRGAGEDGAAARGRGTRAQRLQERLGSSATNPQQLLRMAESLWAAAVDFDPAVQAWHPGLEDGGYGELEQRLEVLMERLGVAGAADPSQRLGACCRMLKAFRQGELGAYSLDDDVAM